MPLCLAMIRHLPPGPIWRDRACRSPGTPVGELTFKVFNPSTGKVLADLPDMSVEKTRRRSRMAALNARERSDMLWPLASVVRRRPRRVAPAFFTHSCSVCAVRMILAAIDETAAQREACSPS